MLGGELIITEPSSFPRLFDKIPPFNALPAVTNPRVVNLTKAAFDRKFILLLTHNDNINHACSSIRNVWDKIHRFSDLDCLVFMLSTKSWLSLKKIQKQQSKYGGLDGRNDINLLSIQTSLRKLGILNLDAPLHRAGKSCYPGYFLLDPQRILIEYCFIKDPANTRMESKVFSGTRRGSQTTVTIFEWPISKKTVDRFLMTLETITPLYKIFNPGYNPQGPSITQMIKDIRSFRRGTARQDNVDPRVIKILTKIFNQ